MLVNSKGKIRSVRQAVWAGVELLAHDIESGHPEVLSECLKAMARFHTYSFGNVLLISTQRPTATQVAGWRGWNELGRRIKQGEKGILIFAPILAEPRQQEQQAQPNGENGEAAEPQQELLGFRQVRVWDVSQTEGEPAPADDLFADLELSEVLSKLTEFRHSGFPDRAFRQDRAGAGNLVLRPDSSYARHGGRGNRFRADSGAGLADVIRDQAPQLCNPRCLAQRSKGRCFCGRECSGLGDRASRKNPALPEQSEPAGRELGSSAAHFCGYPWGIQPRGCTGSKKLTPCANPMRRAAAAARRCSTPKHFARGATPRLSQFPGASRFHTVYTVHTVHTSENGKENQSEPKSFLPRSASNHSETQLRVTEARSFTFFHVFSGRQSRSRQPRCRIRQRLRFLAWLLYVGQYSSPAPRPRSSTRNTRAEDCLAQPLTRDELTALIDFFLLLDGWDRKKKIT